MLKRLVKQRNHYLSSAKKSFKNQENFKQNGTPEIFSKNRRFSAKTGGLESPQFLLRAILVITETFHKLYLQQHSERLTLRSGKTRSYQHLNIKVFAFLIPCPKLIDVLIWITITSETISVSAECYAGLSVRFESSSACNNLLVQGPKITYNYCLSRQL